MTEISIRRARDTDLAAILDNYPRFWGDREQPRALHHPMFVIEFGDTAFVARRDGQVLAYLLGFVAPTGDAYVHFIAVRDDARGLGLGRRLYERFTEAAVARGAKALKAITSPGNAGSLAFHRALGFTLTLAEEYGGTGQPRVVMRKLVGGPAGGVGGDPSGKSVALWRLGALIRGSQGRIPTDREVSP